ncbi:Oidioi.mRNA.OKI2018_I69.XSR.g15802.t1.cds [Oikopleura dioica]|uniref:Oidioi.mRNA.OKI2018_I69.XSR.g15802.t1.cds n=1 Tax=Oikopleura dioica TaxID=34765 RepID=A0ABN7SE11_OIKDI|nr:Oidioi.mRNA.OKI2018_I69.XSR.g15802.t1.cds [Oikopleura dioica]
MSIFYSYADVLAPLVFGLIASYALYKTTSAGNQFGIYIRVEASDVLRSEDLASDFESELDFDWDSEGEFDSIENPGERVLPIEL